MKDSIESSESCAKTRLRSFDAEYALDISVRGNMFSPVHVCLPTQDSEIGDTIAASMEVDSRRSGTSTTRADAQDVLKTGNWREGDIQILDSADGTCWRPHVETVGGTGFLEHCFERLRIVHIEES